MSEAKEDASRLQRKTLAEMNKWMTDVDWCRSNVIEISRKSSKGDNEPEANAFRQQLQQMESRLDRTLSSMREISGDLEHLKDYFGFQRAVFELRKFAFDSWPESLYLRQMLWVSTILFSLGGAAFTVGAAVAGGESGLWLLVPGVFWLFGGCLVLKYLSGLRYVDRQKMEYYAREFDMGEDLRQIALRVVDDRGRTKETRYTPAEESSPGVKAR